MAGPNDGSNSAWRLNDLKELEQTLNYDIASGFSDLEITGLTKEVGAYNMRWVTFSSTEAGKGVGLSSVGDIECGCHRACWLLVRDHKPYYAVVPYQRKPTSTGALLEVLLPFCDSRGHPRCR